METRKKRGENRGKGMILTFVELSSFRRKRTAKGKRKEKTDWEFEGDAKRREQVKDSQKARKKQRL